MIVTLQLGEKAKSFFNPLRKQFFPGHINYLDAHLTLFYSLPSNEPQISMLLESFSNRKEMELYVSGIENFGKGVAYTINSTALQTLHLTLQEKISHFLKGKDLDPLKPHITVQNNVTAYKAKLLYEKLFSGFSPFMITATGFSTFQYENGPWIPLQDYPFKEYA